MFAPHMEEVAKDKVVSIEDHSILKDFEDVLKKFQDCTKERH
jgi:hypothetical protein